LQLGETQLHVIQAELKGVAREPTGRHIAFYVEDLEAAVATLAAEGVAHDRFGGVVFLADPGGNTIELQQGSAARRRVSTHAVVGRWPLLRMPKRLARLLNCAIPLSGRASRAHCAQRGMQSHGCLTP
jgi:hypothetical protein